MAAAGLWRSSSSLRPSPADSPLIDSGAGGGAGRGRSQGGASRRLPTPLGLPPPAPPTLHPFPQRIGRRPAGAGALGPPPLLPSARLGSQPSGFCFLSPRRALSRRGDRAVLPAGPPYSQTCCFRISRPLLSSRRPPLKSAPRHPARGCGGNARDQAQCDGTGAARESPDSPRPGAPGGLANAPAA